MSYQIHGAVVFKDVLTTATGSLFLYRDDFSSASKDFKNSYKSVFDVLFKINKQYSEVKNLIENVGSVLSFLKLT